MRALESEDPRSVGDYRLVRRLGAGGMGRVFLGMSPGGRRVAVKVVHAELVQQPEFHSRFRREVLANRLVSGAYTASVIDADSYAPTPWLVTSYVPGPSLQQAVADLGSLPPATVSALAAALAEALTSIHDAGLVHRDLKPSNVLLAEDGPRVIDFGIARISEASRITRTGTALGSPGFMSPEQVNGSTVTPASDVFSLGTVLAYAATGVNPFGEGPAPALGYRAVYTEPDLGAVECPALRTLIADCLAKTAEQRPTPRDILIRAGFDGQLTTLLDNDAWLPAARRVRISDQAIADADTVTGNTTVGLGAPADATPPAPPEPEPRRRPIRRSVLLSASAVLAVAGIATGLHLSGVGTSSPGGPVVPADGIMLENATTRMCAEGQGRANGLVRQAGCRETDDNQVWNLKETDQKSDHDGKQLFLIQSVKDDSCMDLPDMKAKREGTSVGQFDCKDTDDDNQLWWIDKQKSGDYWIRNSVSDDKCLDVAGEDGGGPGTALTIYRCSNNDDQEWRVKHQS